MSIFGYDEILRSVVRLIAEKCPRLVRACYWAGTSCISLEELHHRESFDLDFHTKRALFDVRPLLVELQNVFNDGFEITHTPDEYGSGFRGILTLPSGYRITIEILSNYDDVDARQLVSASAVSTLKRITIEKYLADKIQCIEERTEARDLLDITAVLQRDERFEELVKKLLAEQDVLIMTEKLLAWSNDAIYKDLTAYKNVDPEEAVHMRDVLLNWVREC